MGDTEDGDFMLEHGAVFWPYIEYNGEYWRLLTAAFLHFGFMHLFNNMLVLGFLGDNLERALGKLKYGALYITGAVGSNFCSFIIDKAKESYSVSAGASGAVFAVVGGMIYVLIRNKGRLEDLDQRRLILFVLMSLYMGYTTASINNTAHISGLFIGFIAAAVLYRKKAN